MSDQWERSSNYPKQTCIIDKIVNYVDIFSPNDHFCWSLICTMIRTQRKKGLASFYYWIWSQWTSSDQWRIFLIRFSSSFSVLISNHHQYISTFLAIWFFFSSSSRLQFRFLVPSRLVSSRPFALSFLWWWCVSTKELVYTLYILRLVFAHDDKRFSIKQWKREGTWET